MFEALKAFERPGRGPDGSPARGLGTGSRSVRVEWWDRSFSGLAALSEPPDPYWDFVQKLKRDKSDALLRRLGIRRVVKHPALGAPYGTSKPRASKGDLYAPIRAALDNAYTDPNGWVPCSERLPDLWEGVEAWAGDVYKNVWARRTTDRRFKPERVVWSVHGCTSVAAQHITHWRPKTPPPQKG